MTDCVLYYLIVIFYLWLTKCFNQLNLTGGDWTVSINDDLQNESEDDMMLLLSNESVEVMSMESPLLMEEPPSSSSSCCFDSNSEFNFDHNYRLVKPPIHLVYWKDDKVELRFDSLVYTASS